MKNTKTQKEYFEEIITLAKANDRQDLADFAQDRINLLDKKAANKKPNKVQQENEKSKVKIVEVLADTTAETGKTATEILKELPELVSNQKVSALLRQLVESGVVTKEVLKGKKTVFYLTPEADDEDTTEDDNIEEDSVQALDGEITY